MQAATFVDGNMTLLLVSQPNHFAQQQIATALAYVHKENVIHNDIKPGNIIMCPHSNTMRPVHTVAAICVELTCVLPQQKLADFGAVAEEGAQRRVYTERWAAPEVCRGGQGSKASDVYAFGRVLRKRNRLGAHFLGQVS